MDVYFQDPRSKVLGRIRSCSSLQKFERVTYCTMGVFFYLKPFMNILHFGTPLSRRDISLSLLCKVATLDLHVARLVWIPSRTSRRWISTSRRHFCPSSGTSRHWLSTSRRWFCTPLESRDVGFQRRDVGFNHSLERRDVGSQRHDVGCFPLWNVATLHSYVATLTLFKAKPPPFFLLPCSLA